MPKFDYPIPPNDEMRRRVRAMRGPLKKAAIPTNEERRALILKWAASNGTRFVRSKRRALVAAVNDGLFSLQEVQAMFRLSIDEYLEWVTEP